MARGGAVKEAGQPLNMASAFWAVWVVKKEKFMAPVEGGPGLEQTEVRYRDLLDGQRKDKLDVIRRTGCYSVSFSLICYRGC